MAYVIKDYDSKAKCLHRPSMEDYYNIFMEKDFWSLNICDGHGGYHVAEFVNNNFSYRLYDRIAQIRDVISENDFKQIIFKLVKDLDSEIEKEEWGRNSGSTMVAVVFFQNRFYFVNIGDSNIITPLFSNRLHVPEDKEERKRVLKFDKIKDGRIAGVINLTRAFGDFRFKNGAMIVTPEITVHDVNDYLRHNNPWILLASDGLTLIFEREKLTPMINDLFHKGNTCIDIVSKIFDVCKELKNKDNTTVILLHLLNV